MKPSYLCIAFSICALVSTPLHAGGSTQESSAAARMREKMEREQEKSGGTKGSAPTAKSAAAKKEAEEKAPVAAEQRSAVRAADFFANAAAKGLTLYMRFNDGEPATFEKIKVDDAGVFTCEYHQPKGDVILSITGVADEESFSFQSNGYIRLGQGIGSGKQFKGTLRVSEDGTATGTWKAALWLKGTMRMDMLGRAI